MIIVLNLVHVFFVIMEIYVILRVKIYFVIMKGADDEVTGSE